MSPRHPLGVTGSWLWGQPLVWDARTDPGPQPLKVSAESLKQCVVTAGPEHGGLSGSVSASVLACWSRRAAGRIQWAAGWDAAPWGETGTGMRLLTDWDRSRRRGGVGGGESHAGLSALPFLFRGQLHP